MQQPTTLPEDLTTLTDEDLSKLAADVREAAEALEDDARTDDGALSQIEKLVEDFDRLNAEVAARETRKAERAERASAALNKFNGEDDSAPAPDDAVVAEPELVDAAASIEEPAPVAAPEAEVAPVAPVAEASASVAPIPTSEDAVSDSTSPSTAVASLDAARPEALAPRVADDVVTAGLRATNAITGTNEGTTLSNKALAKAITDKRHGFSGITGASERIILGHADLDLPHKVGGGEQENFSVFDAVRSEWASGRKADTALVAAGGVCAPLEPNYDFFRLAEPVNPVEGSLPVVEAPRGGIRYISPPDFRDAAGGVRITTEAQDAAGYGTGQGETAPKPCVRVTCPPVEECRVDAVSQCVTFGNLNYRVFPEQVESFLEDLAVIFTQTKEVFYLDAIDAASTDVTFTPGYSAVRGLTYTLLAAAANYRRRHHMAIDAVLSLYLPSWVVEFLKVDLINDHAMGLGFLGAGLPEVTSVFATMALDVNWYYDSATGAGQSFNQAQAAGGLNLFPSSVVGYLFAPGTFVRLNAGTLDVGVVRDSVLNGTNDLQIFSEEWIQVCMVGLESLRLEISLCPDGTAPEPVAPLDCLASV